MKRIIPLTLAAILCTVNLIGDSLPQSHFLLKREGYYSGYDGRLKQSSWVCETISKESIEGSVKRDKFSFTEDRQLPACVRSILKDYSKSGFDRGHMAPAANHCNSQKSMRDTFLLSNMSPQIPNLNRGSWAKLEAYVRGLVYKHGTVEVISGPLFLPETRKDGKKFVSYQVVGDSNVAVPTHYFKIIRAKRFEEAYVMPNRIVEGSPPLDEFLSTVKKVEKLAGIVF